MTTRLLTLGVLAALAIAVAFAACVNPREGYAPTQPIAFSHALHAGANQIPCMYCHVSVGEGPHASVPSVNVCMNCHSQVRGATPQAQREIAKITSAWQNNEPIQWVKVHDLPDHARFSHQPHIVRGIDCSECHGQVNTMEVVATQNAFNMGWCVNCHRQEQYNAPVDCVTCHY